MNFIFNSVFFFQNVVPVPSYGQFSDFKIKFFPQVIWKTAKDMKWRLVADNRTGF